VSLVQLREEDDKQFSYRAPNQLPKVIIVLYMAVGSHDAGLQLKLTASQIWLSYTP